jgi:flagellar biosynthesis/type III secretory pathway M-ring protein FliF/YscJ
VEEELPAPTPAQQLPEPAAAQQQLPEPAAAAAPEAPQPEVVPQPAPDPLRNQLIAVAEEDPQLIAELIQSWLAESKA